MTFRICKTLLLFHDNNGYTNRPTGYTYTVLSSIILKEFVILRNRYYAIYERSLFHLTHITALFPGTF
jgi:hypothetical protein